MLLLPLLLLLLLPLALMLLLLLPLLILLEVLYKNSGYDRPGPPIRPRATFRVIIIVTVLCDYHCKCG